eukprot:g7877.t1
MMLQMRVLRFVFCALGWLEFGGCAARGTTTTELRWQRAYRLCPATHTYVVVPGSALRVNGTDFVAQDEHLGLAIERFAADHALPFKHRWKLQQTTLQHVDWERITTEQRFFVVAATDAAALAALTRTAARHTDRHAIVAVALGFQLDDAHAQAIANMLQSTPGALTCALALLSATGEAHAAIALNAAVDALPPGSLVAVLAPGVRLVNAARLKAGERAGTEAGAGEGGR